MDSWNQHDFGDDNGGIKGRNLEENLRSLRKKEERLRKEKLLLMQNDVFGSPVVSHDLDDLSEDVPPDDGIGERERETSTESILIVEVVCIIVV